MGRVGLFRSVSFFQESVHHELSLIVRRPSVSQESVHRGSSLRRLSVERLSWVEFEALGAPPSFRRTSIVGRSHKVGRRRKR